MKRINRFKEKIGYAVGSSSFGKILVASCEMGVLAILLEKNEKALLQKLQERFPDVDPRKGDWNAQAVLARVIKFVETPGAKLDLPLYLRGTPFQKRVWRAVQEIPAGKTASYLEIARKIGSPRAMRAVGSTCTKNNLFMAVPCHRVISSDGSASAWRRMLIDREAKVSRHLNDTSSTAV